MEVNWERFVFSAAHKVSFTISTEVTKENVNHNSKVTGTTQTDCPHHHAAARLHIKNLSCHRYATMLHFCWSAFCRHYLSFKDSGSMLQALKMYSRWSEGSCCSLPLYRTVEESMLHHLECSNSCICRVVSVLLQLMKQDDRKSKIMIKFSKISISWITAAGSASKQSAKCRKWLRQHRKYCNAALTKPPCKPR